MNFLLDTHTILWFITDDKRLPSESKKIIQDIRNNCYISIASLWEIAIKHSLGKLQLIGSLEDVFMIIEKSGLRTLPISKEHILALSTLHFYHRDPFDRIIIAQAKLENFTIISIDEQFANYNINIYWK